MPRILRALSPALFACLLLLAALLPTLARASDPIEPEKAFAMRARVLDAQTIEVAFDIAPGYYLYRDKIRIESDPPAFRLGTPDIPPGKMKEDAFFGQVATFRDGLQFLVPVEAPPGETLLRIEVSSQGCWDGGICYPPTLQQAELDLSVPSGGPAGSFSTKNGNSALASLGASTTASGGAATPAQPAAVANGDESSRIAALLQGASLPLVLVSFLGFGLLLAFTPCTFPMIPILSGIIVGHGHAISRGRAFMLSLAYVLGMAVTYAAAGVAAGLTGTLLAAALQNVWVLSAFALLFVLLALSMFGFYELQLPTALQSRLASQASHEKGGHLGGVAIMGALSALIVGPCVAAPLAGALLYIAQTGDAVLGGLALFAMAIGMGLPLLAVGLAARSVLPKVGPWMEGVKKAFGVILLGVAIWLVSPVLPALLTMLAWAALLLFSGIFLRAIDPLPSHAAGWQRFWKGVGVTLLIAGAAMLLGALAGSRDPLQPLAVLRAQAAENEAPHFTRVASVEELDARLAAATRPVMLDFYADWCVSCKEMERYTFADPAIAPRLREFELLQADVTANTPADAALLKRFGLFGPPGIIFFAPGGREINGLRVIGYQEAAAFGDVLGQARAQR